MIPKTSAMIMLAANVNTMLCVWLNICIIMTPVNASCDPTDKSIPPVIITRVIPSAIIPITELFLKILIILLNDKNMLPLNITARTNNTTNAISALLLPAHLFQSLPFTFVSIYSPHFLYCPAGSRYHNILFIGLFPGKLFSHFSMEHHVYPVAKH